MQRDWLLGFPPVLLAHDECCEAANFPLGIPNRLCAKTAKQAKDFIKTLHEIDFEMTTVRPEITEADCRQVKTSADAWRAPSKTIAGATWANPGPVTVCVYDIGSNEWPPSPKLHHYMPLVMDEASPVTVPQPTKPGVWRRTEEHKPPKVGVYVARFEDREDTACDGWWDGEHWHNEAEPESPRASLISLECWKWLDSSGEFKVGDRVRVIEAGGGAVKPGATGVIVDAHGGRYLKIDGRAGLLWAWDAGWLEHA